MAELISGKTLAAKLKAEAAAEAAELREKGVHARLAVVIVGENPASRTYVAGKAKDCAAGAVLLFAAASFVIGCIIFIPKLLAFVFGA